MKTHTLSEPNSVIVKDNQVMINGSKEFAILERRVNSKGYQGITFSIKLTHEDAIVIHNSKIARVVSFTDSGTLLFERKDFYDNILMYELIIDILKRHEEKKEETHKHLA